MAAVSGAAMVVAATAAVSVVAAAAVELLTMVAAAVADVQRRWRWMSLQRDYQLFAMNIAVIGFFMLLSG